MLKISYIKQIITIAICLGQVAIFNIYAQKPLDGGVSASYSIPVSPRWALSFDGSIYQQFNKYAGTWGSLAAKGQFKALERRILFASTSISHQEYNNIKNSDTELKLTEGIEIQTQSIFTHGFFLTQRKIFYKPTNDNAFCSDATYYQQFDFTGISSCYYPYIAANATFNITPDISNAPVLQRFRIGGGLAFKVSERIKLTISYTHAMGSKRQIFIGDADKMNLLSIGINFTHFNKSAE